MKKSFVLLCISIIILFSCSNDNQSLLLQLESKSFRLGINPTGKIIEFIDAKTSTNYIDQDSTTSLLSIRVDNAFKESQSATLEDEVLTLTFENDIEARIKYEIKESYVTFELIALSDPEKVELVLWGPYYNSIDKVIGETVGVVRGEEFALGIQSLNIKTLGGYPWNESDRMPAFDVISQDDPNEMHPKSDGSVLYRVEAAKPTTSGSSLQAYCRNRSKERIIQDFNHEKIVAPTYEDGGVVGSKIALFGSPVENALNVVGQIEIGEGLPHPMIDGQWGKLSPDAAAAYIITDFTEDNVEDAIAITKQAGLSYMYHYGKTFENWGHFELYKGEFPNGVEGLRKCVEKAAAEGIMVGTHFLSNFITTNDPYVTPVPDNRLAKVGTSIITRAINRTETEILIESPDFFNQMKNNTLKTVMIDDELIRYGSVSESEPWKLLDCQRGAFETIASAHEQGTQISKLLDHAYKVFLTNADLTIEMSERMAKLYNETGLRQISFDGLEGNRSTGLGTYGESLMPYVWYNNLSPELKEHLIIDASRTTHFFWHIYSRMNWGEPWYGGFRESQTEYRFKNQAYFKRNFMPGMLGWFKMTPETSLEDIEWLLARSAGYDAGYAFVANKEAFEKNGNTDAILEQIGKWEKLRIGGVFTEDQKENMRNSDKEFSLDENSDGWILTEIQTDIFKHEKKVRQPGEPLTSSFEFENKGEKQTLGFIITALNSEVSDIVLELNNYKKVTLPVSLKAGQILKYTGGKTAEVYNDQWQVFKEIEIKSEDFSISDGGNTISIDCSFDQADKEASVKLELRSIVGNTSVKSQQ